MRVMTKWLLLGALLAAPALLDFGAGSAAEPGQPSVERLNGIRRMAEESAVDLRGLEYVLSDPAADPAIAEAIRAYRPEYADVTPAEIAAGAVAPRFFFNRVDLNDDGSLEVVAFVVSPACGSGGCPALVLEHHADGYRVIGDFVGVETPIIVSEAAATDGWRKLLLPPSGGDGEFRLFVFDGGRYQEAGDGVDLRSTAWRTALISDEIRADTPGHALALPSPEATGSQRCPAGEGGDLAIGGIAIGASATDVRDLLGDPASTSARELWDADGKEHQRWRYPEKNVSISMVFDGEEHAGRVEQIAVEGKSSLRAACEIGIGSTERDVADAFGEAPGQGGRRMVGDPWAGLELVFEGGRVVEMRLGASAE
jgi:hypothetical protein